jgi:D-tyrosyl-tRNA(Tyr) deacylase
LRLDHRDHRRNNEYRSRKGAKTQGAAALHKKLLFASLRLCARLFYMRAVVQRVMRASVTIEGESTGEIGKGLVVLLGVARDDTREDADYLAAKIAALRIFDDAEGRMNVSAKEMNGGLLIVSQFTLYGDVRRGLRPSWSDAAAPEVAEPLYDYFVERSRKLLGRVETGSFRKTMQVELVNDGPVTILLDSRKGF